MPIDHWMTFSTFAEQRYFIYPSVETYAGVVINGNMAAHAPAGLAGFILEKTGGLPYIIDPLTHAFQHDPSAILAKGHPRKPKSSIQKLADAFGAPVADCVGRRPVRPSHFSSGASLEDFTASCIQFQKTVLTEAMADSDASKYLDPAEAAPGPYAVVAPYFYMTETTVRHWLPVCRLAAELALRIEKEARVFGAVVVGQGVVLNEAIRTDICDAFADLDLDGLLLWVDDLYENEAGGGELEGLLLLSRGLRREGSREVINLHGGYFSILAAGRLGAGAMSGVSHGPEFGEHRSVVPVGGGIPIARYYVPRLHARMRYREALHVFAENGWLEDAATFHANVCDCPACHETLDGSIDNFTLFGEGNVREVRRGRGLARIEFPTAEAKSRCLKHYLQRKAVEYRFAHTASRVDLLDDAGLGLRPDVTPYEEVAGLDAVSHLALWDSILA